METNQCNFCGGEMKLVPAGTSKKTGKPYNAFYSCKSCGKTRQTGQGKPSASPASKVAPDAKYNALVASLATIQSGIEEILDRMDLKEAQKVKQDKYEDRPDSF